MKYFLSTLSLLALLTTSYAQLSGSYTIGGTNPNYTNIAEAIDSLNTFGVSGPVTFQIRDGIYNQQASIGSIAGGSSANSVTFASESGDSSAVVWTYTPSSSMNYTCRFYGCDYVTIDGITIKAIGSSYAKPVDITNSSQYCTIKNCVIEAPSTTSTSYNLTAIYEGSGTNSNTLIENNKITNGSYGMYFDGPTELEIRNNEFSGQYYSAIHVDNCHGVKITGNQVNSSNTYSNYRGINVEYCNNQIEVLANRIDMNYGYYGIMLTHCDGTYSAKGLIGNNFVHLGGSGTGYGIYCDDIYYQQFYYNSVNISRNGSGNYAFYIADSYYSSNVQLQNNIFANTGNGYAIRVNPTSSLNSSDYNNFYSEGSYVGQWGSSNCYSISNWKSYSGMDANSVSFNPEFISEDDLHVQAYQLDNLGYGVPGITHDIDGELRDLNTPDIGADEWSTPANDAGVISINEGMTYCIENDSVFVTIKNFGSSPLTSVNVNWEVNTVTQTPFAWTGNLDQGQSEGPFSIGFYDFDLGTNYDIVAWTTQPNGGSEGFDHNDQTQILGIYQSMSGTYTIGGSNPDYLNIQAAVTDLTNGGVCGPVTLLLRDGIYNQQVSIDDIQGTSANNTVTLKSESGDSTAVTWTFTPNSSMNYTCRLYGCDYVKIEGITIRAIGSTYARPIDISSSAQHCEIRSCIIEAPTTSSTSGNQAAIYEGSGTNSYTIIENNKFNNGSYGVYFDGLSGLEIKNNEFTGQYYSAIHVDNCSAVKVIGNRVTGNSGYSSYRAINFEACNGQLEVLGNRVNMTSGYYGIRLSGCDASYSSYGLIGNNFVAVGGSSGTGYGVYCDDISYQQFFYNSVNVSRSGSSNYAFYVADSYYSSYIQLQNNIFANTANGYAIRVNPTSSLNSSDYNNFYSEGSYLGQWGSSNCYGLLNWKNYTSMDANSVSVDPEFLSNSELYVQAYQLDNLGYGVTGITHDIDGNLRDLNTPDLGAVEWTTPANDAGLTSIDQGMTYCIENDSVFVTIKNYGTAALTTVNINWSVNAVTQTPFSWSGSLPQGQSEGPFSIGFYDFELGPDYDVVAWTSEPNGGTEGFTHNDQSQIYGIYQAMSGTYTIGGSNPDYTYIQDAVTDLTNGGVCGPVTLLLRDGVYNQQVSIGQVQGTSFVNTVTITAESGDSTAVTWTYTPNSSMNYTCRLYGCDYVIIDGITLRAIGSTYARPLDLSSSAQNCEVRNCIIEAPSTTNSNTNQTAIYEGSGTNSNTLIENNIVMNGSYGVYFDGPSGLEIKNNMFIDQYHTAIHTANCSAVKISQNQTENTGTSYSSYTAIDIQSCSGHVEVVANRIDMSSGYYGIRMTSCDASYSSYGLVGNNFVHVGGSSGTGYGIYCDDVAYQQFYYNSVNVSRSGSSNYAFYVADSHYSSYIQLQNNIFANSANGYAIRINPTSSLNSSDYNNLYSEGSYLGQWGSTNCYGLTNWKNYSAMDANSVSIDPEFLSNSDLHVQAYQLDNLGYGLLGITHDIDGELRDLNTPDMGADEWTTPVNDAGVTSIDQGMTYCIENDSVFVTIKNFGVDTLMAVSINWEVNAVAQPVFSWTGSLAQGQSVGPFSIGYYDFDLGSDYDVVAWTSAPNGGTEGFTHNDQSQIYGIYQAMSGNYTIGGTNPDYLTIQDAVNDLNNGGVCGAVTFLLRDGIYNQQVSIGQLVGTSSVNTVTFTAESGDSSAVTWTYTPSSSQNYTCRLYGCDYVILDGLTIRAIGSSYARPIDIANSAQNCIVRNCIIEAPATTNTNQNQAAICEGSGTNSPTLIENNIITNGSYGVYFDGTSGLEIRNNTFDGQYYTALHTSSCTSVKVSGNSFTNNNSYSSYQAINLDGCNNQIEVLANRIDMTTGYYGIRLTGCDASYSSYGLIANNFVHIGGSSGTGHGIYCDDISYQRFYYNSVHVSRSGTSNYAFNVVDSYYSSYIQMQNNIFANSANGYAIRVNPTSSINISDYNNLYSTGTYLGRWSSSNCYTLTNWVNYSGTDANSLSVDPGFVSDADLHICNSMLEGAAYPVVGITMDIDGETRAMFTPDIGADEFDNTITLDLPADTFFCGSGVLNAMSPGASYNWSNGANTQTININTSGTYWVEVNSACGTVSDTTVVNILSDLVVDLGADTIICDGNPFILDAGNTGSTYTWSNGIASQTITVANSGSYYVDVSSGNCTGSDTVQVDFGSMPAANFTVNSPVCTGENSVVQFTGTASGLATYNWDFDSGNVSPGTGIGPHNANWNIAGTHNISLTIEDGGCVSSTTTIPVVVNPVPTSGFTSSATTLCENDTLHLNFDGAAGANANYAWDFGTATVISGSNQGPYDLEFTTPGSHPISLTITENGCQSNTTYLYVDVNTIPTATISANTQSLCEGDTIMVEYTGAAGPSAIFSWDFGTGTLASGTVYDTLHVAYQTAGTSFVSLSVEDNGCSSNTVSLPIEVNAIPTSDFTASALSLCENDTLNINFNGLVGANATYNWDFGTATIVSGAGVGPYNLGFTTPGTYPVSLTVSENGCESSSTAISVDVNMVPTASFTISGSELCAGDTLMLEYAGAAGPVANFSWDFGSGSLTSGTVFDTMFVVFPQADTTDILLSVEDNGCVSSPVSQTAIIHPIPTAQFTLNSNNLCSNDTLILNYTGTAGATANYSWDLASANILSGSDAGPYQLQWNTGGAIDLSLSVEEHGCVSEQENHSLTVVQSPTSDFSISNPVCVEEEALIEYLGNATAVATYTWETDGAINTLFGQGPHHASWATQGVKQVALLVEENGCSSLETVVPVSVNPLPDEPVATLTGNIFTSSSSSDIQWLLNGNPIQGATSQFYTATETGFYQVEVSNIYGCSVQSEMVYFDYTSVEEIGENQQIKIYPNPANDLMYVDLQAINGTSNIQLFDLNGREIDLGNSEDSLGVVEIDVSGLGAGTYLLRISNDAFVFNHMVIIH